METQAYLRKKAKKSLEMAKNNDKKKIANGAKLVKVADKTYALR